MSSSIRLDDRTVVRNVVGWVLLVELDPTETKSAGGIEFAPDKIMRDGLACTRGTVLQIADSAWDDEIEKGGKARCSVGDRILFRQYAGEYLDVEGEKKYRVINDKDVYMVLEPRE